jgi:hypothetical protein
MGNTLCKPVINPPIQNVEQSKDIEPLLTEEAIKILVVNEPISEATVSEATVTEPEKVVSEATVTEPEKVVSEAPVIKEEVVSEATVSEATVSEATVSEATVSEATVIKEEESRVDTLVNEEKLSVVLPPDDLKEDELVTPMKKKRGRKKKGEQ